jgi:hypothetical protein
MPASDHPGENYHHRRFDTARVGSGPRGYIRFDLSATRKRTGGNSPDPVAEQTVYWRPNPAIRAPCR